MGGLLIAFEDYNVIKGVFGSPWVGLEYFKRFLSSPDFMNYLLNTLKLSAYGLLWSFPVPIILALLLQQIWYVELPAIKDIIVIQFILQAGNIMSIGFEKAYALQTDMNLPASEILSTYVYRIGLLNGDYGYSTAVGLFNAVVNVILLIFVNTVVKKMNDGEGL